MSARVAVGGGRGEFPSAATMTAPPVRRSGPNTRAEPADLRPMSRPEAPVASERRQLERPRVLVLSGDDAAAIDAAASRAAPASIAGSTIAVRPTIGATLAVLLEPAPVEPDTAAVVGAILVVAVVFAIVIVLSLVGL